MRFYVLHSGGDYLDFDLAAVVGALNAAGETALMLAAARGTPPTVVALLEHGAPLELRSHAGCILIQARCWSAVLPTALDSDSIKPLLEPRLRARLAPSRLRVPSS